MPRHYRLGHRAHADGIGAQPGEGAYLRRSLITRSRDCNIDAGVQAQRQLPGCLDEQPIQRAIVNTTQIHKRRAAVRPFSAQGILRNEVNMIRQQHEITGTKTPIDSARRVGQQQSADSERGQDANRQSQRPHRMPFIKMGAPAQNQHRRVSQMAEHQLAGVTSHAHVWKAWEFGIGNLRLDAHPRERVLKSTPQNDAQRGPQIAQLAQTNYRQLQIISHC